MTELYHKTFAMRRVTTVLAWVYQWLLSRF